MAAYKVTVTVADKSHPAGTAQQTRVVEAANAAQARNHVAKGTIAVAVIGAAEAMELAREGVELEHAAAA